MLLQVAPEQLLRQYPANFSPAQSGYVALFPSGPISLCSPFSLNTLPLQIYEEICKPGALAD